MVRERGYEYGGQVFRGIKFVNLVVQVDSTYPELADLLLVVLKTLLSKPCVFEADKGTVFMLCHYLAL